MATGTTHFMRPLRVLTGLFIAVSVGLAINMEVFPSIAAWLQERVHTGEPEWQEMYRNLIGSLPLGLLIAAAIGSIAFIVSGRLHRVVDWLASRARPQFLWIMLLTAAALRIGWLLLFSTRVWADGIWYHGFAQSLAQGKGYSWPDGTATAYLPIGYPAILSVLYSIFGEGMRVGKMFNLLLSVGMLPIIYDVYRAVWNERAARMGTMLLAITVTHFAFVNLLFSEMLFTFLLMLGVWAVVRSSEKGSISTYDVMIGIVAGISALVRPIGLLLPVALLIALLWRKASLRLIGGRMALIGFFALAMLVPNIVRNYIQFHAFVPFSTNGGINFLIGNNPDATGYYTPPAGVELTGNEAEQSSQAYALGRQWLFSHPAEAVVLAGKKFFHLYHRDDSGILFSCVATQTPPPWILAATAIVSGNAMYWIVLFLGISYLVRYRGSLTLNEYFLIFLWCCVTLAHLLYFGSHRFHMPLIPVWIGFAAAWMEGKLEQREHDLGVSHGH